MTGPRLIGCIDCISVYMWMPANRSYVRAGVERLYRNTFG